MIENKRRLQAQQALGLHPKKEVDEIRSAKKKEEKRRTEKKHKQQDLANSFSYKSVHSISKALDEWWLDGILGFFQGVGDIANAAFTLPFLYVSLFKIRSIPLTLACIYNMLLDILIGIIPFGVGNILDFFHRSYRKNLKLIVGFVEDDKNIIDEVNRKASFMAIAIFVICLVIYWLISFVISLASSIKDWFSGLF